ncbi:MAG TPA: cytochrome c [Gaiellaceae bacterium]|nr:cytochrome c [Gaiellaceae bacterium]
MKRLALFASLILALGAVGCGGGGDTTATPETVEGTLPTTEASGAGQGDPAAGKQVFQTAGCGSCHTLKDAGTTGQIGPNLDDAKPSHDLVVERVTKGKGAMPTFKDKLTDKQIQDVAAYVSSVAGK